MSKSRSLLLPLACLLIGGVGIAGCGESVIKDDELTASIKQQYEEQTGVKMTSIECEEVKAEEGAAISCRAENDSDVSLELTGTVKGEGEDDKWGFDWKVARADAPGKLFEDAAMQTVSSKFGVAVESVKCPERITVEKGEVVHCEATDNKGETRGLTLRLTDADGGFRVTIDQK